MIGGLIDKSNMESCYLVPVLRSPFSFLANIQNGRTDPGISNAKRREGSR